MLALQGLGDPIVNNDGTSANIPRVPADEFQDSAALTIHPSAWQHNAHAVPARRRLIITN